MKVNKQKFSELVKNIRSYINLYSEFLEDLDNEKITDLEFFEKVADISIELKYTNKLMCDVLEINDTGKEACNE